MLFSSIPFLYYFLPAVLLIYFISPKVLKNSVLLLASLLFYAWGEPKYILLMAASILLSYVFGILIEKSQGGLQKLYLATFAAAELLFLIYFKYVDFFISNINAATGLSIPLLKLTMPIGISFYTFQTLSYAVDVYRKNVKAQRNIIKLATYVALFPQLIAGPIVRYIDIEPKLSNREHSFERAYLGAQRFILGLSKKVLIANLLGEFCDTFKASDEKSVLFYWGYAIAFSLHIYFDFSGYSDMAIGLGRMFGFDFLENFNYPFISKSITEFWRRWHISLGSWFRDYVYIPLGGNRVGKVRLLFNIFVVWALTGFWHGAAWNFIIWGVMFAILLIIEKLWLLKLLEKANGAVRHIYVMLLVIISFVIFNAASLGEAGEYIRGMFGMGGVSLVTADTQYYLRNYAVVFLLGLIGCTPLLSRTMKRLDENKRLVPVLNVLKPVGLMVLLFVVTAFLVDGSFNPFLYFRF